MRNWIAAALLLLIAGCGAPGGPAPVGPAPGGPAPGGPAVTGTGAPVHPFPLTITRTGGFAGVDQSITVRSDGSWSYGAGKAKPATQGTLTQAELDQVTRILSDPAFPADVRPHRTEGVCSDGFTYSVTIGPESSSFEDCGEVDRPLFDALLATLHQRTPF
jgi:hypothetical protein